MQIRSIQETAARYTSKSMMAYLEGEKNLNWIAGVIGASDMTKSRKLFVALRGYGKPERYRELSDWFAGQSESRRL